MNATVATCRACGEPAELDARFCGGCGRPLDRAAVAPVAAGAAPEAQPRGFAGESSEIKQATVLLADIAGSVALAEQVGPEDWHQVVSTVFAILSGAARRYGGTVGRFTGDGMIALFGAPVAQEDHAVRACNTALYARDALLAYAADLRRGQGLSFTVRIGLDSGPLVATSAVRDGGIEVNAVGEPVVVAERMERLAEPGRVYLTSRTADLVRHLFEIRDRGTFGGRAGTRTLHGYELVGVAAAAGRFDFARGRGMSRFVGRRGEIARLEGALDRAALGQGCVVDIVGEAGVGKSRLCSEFFAECRRRGAPVFEWHGMAHRTSMPYLSYVENLRHALGIEERDSKAAVRRKIDDGLRALDPDIGEHLGAIHDLLGGAAGGGSPPRDPGSQSHAISIVNERLCAALSRRGVTVVAIEDAHWLDAGTAALVQSLRWTISSMRILLVVTIRPRMSIPWREDDGAVRIDLPALSAEPAIELLDDLLGDHPSVASLKQRILARAAGNPFFLEEIVWALADAGILGGERGHFRLDRAPESIPLPGTLKATLGARIDQLPAEQKAVLQIAATIGPEFDAGLLRAVGGSDDSRIAGVLAALSRAGFLDRAGGDEAELYRFAHPLMHEEAYFSQLAETRAATHARIAEALSMVDASRFDARASLLAHHWEIAGDALQAARWYARAAVWVAPRKVAEALVYWRKVRELLDGREDEESLRLAIEARIFILEHGARTGLPGAEAQLVFDEGERLLAGIDDARAQPRLHSALGQVLVFAGEVDRALLHFQRAAELVRGSEDNGLVRDMRATLVFGVFSIGDFRATVRIAEEILSPWPDPRTASQGAYEGRDLWCIILHAMAIVDMGEVDRARAELEFATEAAQRQGSIEVLAMAWSFAPVIAQIAGDDADLALQRASRAVRLAESLESPVTQFLSRWGLGVAHLMRGEWGHAEAVLRNVVGSARDTGLGLQGEAGMLSHLSDAALGRGAAAEATLLAREAIGAGVRRGTRFFECVARLQLVKCLLFSGDAGAWPEIDDELATTCVMIEEQGVTSLRPVATMLRALRLGAGGDAAAASAALALARQDFDAIGARGHATSVGRLIEQGAMP